MSDRTNPINVFLPPAMSAEITPILPALTKHLRDRGDELDGRTVDGSGNLRLGSAIRVLVQFGLESLRASNPRLFPRSGSARGSRSGSNRTARRAATPAPARAARRRRAAP